MRLLFDIEYQTMFGEQLVMNIVGDDTINHAIIRIPLSATLGEALMNLDTVAYTQPDYFKENFYGLYVTCDPVSQPGAITSISLTDNSNTLLQLYYHNAEHPDKAMRYDYYVTSSDTYFNHIDHDYTQGSPEFVDQLVNGNTAAGQQTVYAQCMGGVRTRVYMPNLEHWADSLEGSHIVINEAKLVLPVDETTVDSLFRLPSNFILLGFHTDSTTYLLPDYFEGVNYFGGTYNTNQQAVIFRISEYMQSVVSGKKENCGLSFGINGAGYNVRQSEIAIGSGGLTGKGFLNGTQTKLKYVPEQETDFIFCTVGEESGFVGSSIVLILFLFLILRLIHVAERQRFAMGRIYGYCVVSILLFHLTINIGMVMGLVPVIGIPLPFFSYGGSNLWGFTILLFIFLRIDAGRNRYN